MTIVRCDLMLKINSYVQLMRGPCLTCLGVLFCCAVCELQEVKFAAYVVRYNMCFLVCPGSSN